MKFKVSNDYLDAFHRLGAKPGREFGEPPAKKLSMLLRPAFVAPKGKTLVWGDWSNIEARVLPWLAASTGAEAKLDIFRAVDADPDEPDIYIRTAGDLLGRDADELWALYKAGDEQADGWRQSHGKVPELSLGFGGGLGALQAMATNYGVYLDEKTAREMIERWRAANAWARMFWGAHGRDGSYGLWGAVNSAIENPETPFTAGRVAYVFDRHYLGGTLFCALPCGRLLTYPAIKWEWREVEDKQTGKLVDRYQLTYLKGYGRSASWYGKFCVDGDALVGTSRGWVPLRCVTPDDLLWDGVEWVRHEGLIYQGKKLTIPVDGVRMTPDHEVLTTGGWVEAKDTNGLVRENVRLPDCLAAGAAGEAWRAVEMGLPVRLWIGEGLPFGRVDEEEPETVSGIVRVQDRRSYRRQTTHARHVEASGLRRVAVDDRPLPSAIASGVEKLRRARHFGVRAMAAVRKFLVGHGAVVPAGAYAGARGKRGQLRAGELLVGDAARAGVEQANVAAAEHGRAFKADGRRALDVALSLEQRPVYDLLNAGPRARFVVLGARGPFIVHNCENVTQAAAASILRRTLKRLDRDWAKTEAGGYARYAEFMPVVMHTHDEVVTEVEEWAERQAGRALHEAMVRNDEWDEGLPLAAGISSKWYYTKTAGEMKL